MGSKKRLTGENEPEPSSQLEQTQAPALPSTSPHDFLPDLPDHDPQPADGVHVGESPVPGLTLKRILRGHEAPINAIAWTPDGRRLASASEDNSVRIWDVLTGRCLFIEEFNNPPKNLGFVGRPSSLVLQVKNAVLMLSGEEFSDRRQLSKRSDYWNKYTYYNVVTDPVQNRLAISGYYDYYDNFEGEEEESYYFLSLQEVTETIKIIRSPGLAEATRFMAFGPKGQKLAYIDTKGAIRILSLADTSDQVPLTISDGTESVCVSFDPHGLTLADTGSTNNTIKVWNANSGQLLRTLEGHTGAVQTVCYSSDGRLLASKGGLADATIRIWKSDTGENIGVIRESVSAQGPHGLAFHPQLPRLASLGENDRVIRIWDIDRDVLLSRDSSESVKYITAKLILVGDSGVGKTGLGWRLAHGHFTEHISTHGQQFWVIDELGITRDDGTECEAVLWDLAGQHVYRPVHTIFLDNVDASLVLFDPTNRQDPLKGVQFWLEQLKGKTRLPPTVLVGARSDRGASVLSKQELDRFCQRYGISGGYVSTSAKEGHGLDQLLAILKEQIPWDEMTTTVTTRTFKRIKEFVLALKENTEWRHVLVSPAELRRRLQSTDETWQFSDAEMMTAVGHLETHGYVTILRSSSGDQFILLAPDLLVDLASSVVLLADKNPRELGAVNESQLLQGKFTFEELRGLEEDEQQILLDAAVLRFLEHSICFRERLDDYVLLVFPGLIRQKRPLQDDIPSTDGISYIVRGRVENLYASLVVLLGYTPSFSRINHWQNQAQYETEGGYTCGFRLVEDREGEIELILYYSNDMPAPERLEFQGLFERFLYQRDVQVIPFPPLRCPNNHIQERAVVIKRQQSGKHFLFCDECGEKTELPDIAEAQSVGLRAAPWLQREEAMARLRNAYEANLSRIKGYRRDWAAPRCYISYLPEQAKWTAKLCHDLSEAGMYLVEEASHVADDDFVLVLDSPAYQQAFRQRAEWLQDDIDLIQGRLADNKRNLIALALTATSTHPHSVDSCLPGDFSDETHYPVSLFDLVLSFYRIPLTSPSFDSLRQTLHKQWEQIPRESRSLTDARVLPKRETKTAEKKEEGTPVSAEYVDFDLHIGPHGHAVATSLLEGQATTDISLKVPGTITLLLDSISKRQADADMLKLVGKALYDWLFPTPIHTHLHQTEAVARRDRAKMRIRMRVEAEEIASLPLEFIYREIGGYFVAVNPGTVFSRYLNLPLPPGRVRRHKRPLRMLAIIADPIDQTRLPPNEWESIIKEALANPLASGQMTLQTVKRATRKEIRDALLKEKPDIIQFVGHGIYRDGKGYLALVDDKTSKTWLVDDERFANLYLGHDDNLGLISLATCESAKSDDPQGFLGIAPKLVQRGTPAVLSMQYKVYVKTAKIFLEDFYTAVAARRPIDWATQSARNAISQELGLDNREFATPVLYMRAKDGNVFS